MKEKLVLRFRQLLGTELSLYPIERHTMAKRVVVEEGQPLLRGPHIPLRPSLKRGSTYANLASKLATPSAHVRQSTRLSLALPRHRTQKAPGGRRSASARGLGMRIAPSRSFPNKTAGRQKSRRALGFIASRPKRRPDRDSAPSWPCDGRSRRQCAPRPPPGARRPPAAVAPSPS